MTKIFCVGSAGKDIFFPTKEGKILETPEDITSQKKIAFELGAKYKIENRFEALGGCAANVAVGLARLGMESACISTVGEDEMGAWVCKELKEKKVGTELMVVEKKNKTDLSAIIVDSPSAERTIFSNKNSSGNLELNAEKIKDAEWIYVGDIQGKWKDQLESIIQIAREGKKKIIFNPREANIHDDSGEVIQAIGLCEAVFVNKDEAIEIVSGMNVNTVPENINDEKFLLEKLKSLEPKVVVITDGKRGAWANDGKKIIYAQGLEVSAVDSTGAGDSFLSGFAAAYIKGKKLEECLKWGIANSGNVVQFYGAVEGLLNEGEIEKKSKEVIASVL
jgi:sugar/nucleoside kinase (ribokinase family)